MVDGVLVWNYQSRRIFASKDNLTGLLIDDVYFTFKLYLEYSLWRNIR
jgi:hypothetical protein